MTDNLYTSSANSVGFRDLVFPILFVVVSSVAHDLTCHQIGDKVS